MPVLFYCPASAFFRKTVGVPRDRGRHHVRQELQDALRAEGISSASPASRSRRQMSPFDRAIADHDQATAPPELNKERVARLAAKTERFFSQSEEEVKKQDPKGTSFTIALGSKR